MIVFSNRRLGPALELLVSRHVAAEMLRATADAAASRADGRWERELVGWLFGRATASERTGGSGSIDGIDVAEIAWSPEHFERQRRFLLDAILGAERASGHTRALRRWAALIEAHPRDSVQVGRRWVAHASH